MTTFGKQDTRRRQTK